MKKVYCLLLFSLSLTGVYAQGWERFYPELSDLDFLYGVVPTPDGGVLLTADDKNGFDPHLLLKLAPGGAPQWLKDQSDFFTGRRPSILPVGNDHLLFAAYNPPTGTTDLTETDANLQVVWTKSFAGLPSSSSYAPLNLNTTTDGYLISYQTGYDDSPVKVIKTNLQGELLWQKTFDFGALGTPMRIFYATVCDSEGNFYLSGVQDIPYVPVLAKCSPTGNLIYLKTYPQPNLIYGFGSLAVLQDSLIAGASSSNIGVINTATGALVSTIPAPYAILATAVDSKLLVYATESGNMSLRKMEWSGSLIWERIFDRPENFESLSKIWSLPDGGVLGLSSVFTGVAYTPYVFRTDANGVTYTSKLYGNIFTDLNEDCLSDTSMANRIVIASKVGDTRYASTDNMGNYDFLIDTGTYVVSVVPPNDLWKLCEDSVTITINSADTLQWNTGITADTSCAWPTIDLSAAFLRRCFSSTYTIAYGNEGNIAADSAVVTLSLDPFLTLESASLPYSDLGNNLYTFFIGDIAPLQSGTFTVDVLVNCDAELGQTHCTSASIGIANPCQTSSLDVPVIQVNAACEGDSVAFTIKNVGGGDMTNLAEFVIIEELIVMRQGEFQLPSQEEMNIKCPANGSTSRIYAGHVPGEAPFFAATTAIEGCNGPVQPGFWNMFPEMFLTQNVDRDCQPNIGSFDPNDKQAVPTGYNTEHYIGRNVDLNYKIRFQNTGTDTAFTITIRDTLSSWLDVSSFRPGAASHPYTWQLLGAGILEFKFENILLPDSNTNLAGSQGYISFNIGQKLDLPLQTLIENRAAIYFDFNAPVLTNTTFHRVGEKFIIVSAWEPSQPAIQVNAIPNPFVSETTLEVKGLASSSPMQLQVFDLQGRIAKEMVDEGGVFRIKKGDLDTGFYLFNIKQNGLVVGQGKLVVQE